MWKIQQKTWQSGFLKVLSYTVIIMVLVLIQFKFKSGTFVSWNDTPPPIKKPICLHGKSIKIYRTFVAYLRSEEHFENTLALT